MPAKKYRNTEYGSNAENISKLVHKIRRIIERDVNFLSAKSLGRGEDKKNGLKDSERRVLSMYLQSLIQAEKILSKQSQEKSAKTKKMSDAELLAQAQKLIGADDSKDSDDEI